jgi:hypothetical protein
MLRLRTHAILGFLLLALVAAWNHWPHLAPGARNWAESGNIAAAVVEGRGFSDPFDGQTGPTAWVPPLPVLVDADVFMVTGVKTDASAEILIILTVLGLALAHVLVVGAVTIPRDRLVAGGAFRLGVSVFFLGVLILLPNGPLQVQSEAWIDILLSAVLLRAALSHRFRPGRRARFGLIVAAALCPLAHAGLCLATALVLAVLGVLDLRAKQSTRAVLVAAGVFVAMIAGWTVRNAIALHRIVPLKSNGWFELYLTNVASPGGLLRAETAFRTLPYFNAAQFERYRTMGEMAFVDSYRAPSLSAIKSDPGHFLRNVAERASNALIYCDAADGSQITHTRFSPKDQAALAAAGELLPLGGPRLSAWLRIDDSPAAAYARIMALKLEHGPAAWGDWANSRVTYEQTYHGFRPVLSGLAIAGLPLLALLAVALARKGRLSSSAAWSLLIGVAMLAPFVLVNHSIRHQMPLLALQSVIVGAACQAWVARLYPKTA